MLEEADAVDGVLCVLALAAWGAVRLDPRSPCSSCYHASKAAQWALTNGARLELAEQGTLVIGLHLGAVDTDFSAPYDGPKGDPADAVRAGLDRVEAGAVEVIADDWSAYIKKSLAGDPTRLYNEIRAMA